MPKKGERFEYDGKYFLLMIYCSGKNRCGKMMFEKLFSSSLLMKAANKILQRTPTSGAAEI
jgi:hypothetical protein